jgi:hypothetical protein
MMLMVVYTSVPPPVTSRAMKLPEKGKIVAEVPRSGAEVTTLTSPAGSAEKGASKPPSKP